MLTNVIAERRFAAANGDASAREDFARSAGFAPQLIDERLRRESQQVLGAFRSYVTGMVVARDAKEA